MTEYKFCSGKHKCPLCKRTKKCQGVPYGHDESTKGFYGGFYCNGTNDDGTDTECYCEKCQDERWDEIRSITTNKVFII